MRILLLNQAFYPDVVSTAQHAADLAAELASAGHDVTVYASRRAYDDPSKRFSASETWRGVRIERIWGSAFGKNSLWRRLADFATFTVSCSLKLLTSRPFDVVIALTSPPLIAFLAALFVRLRGGRLLYWVMDLNPDQALAAGILSARDWRTKVLEAMLRFTLQTSDCVVVLDRFMRERITGRGVNGQKIVTLAPWSHDGVVSFNGAGREAFRKHHGLADKFVVMYSGNHSPCHPLTSVILAAEKMAEVEDVAFGFVGGGTEHARIRAYAESSGRRNIVCLPYQPLDSLSASLSAADLHIVAMGEPYVGVVHPCKVYNILALGTPILYIGPIPSHITDLANESSGEWLYPACHGDVETIVRHIVAAKSRGRLQIREEQALNSEFSQHVLPARLRFEIERLASPHYTHLESESVHPAEAK